ncbi:MAG: toxic anion resistance protein [Lachnospiraceae bacterium]|nr:toxic anion resistance protein [Lachnospiraceae bacterium]
MAIKTDNTVVTNTADESTGVISLAKVEDTRQTFDLAVAREQYKQEILASGEVDKLTSQIDLSNTTSILEFGKAPAAEMAKVADQVMSKYDMTTVQSTSTLIQSLLDVMKKIDIGEIQDAKSLLATQAKKSFFNRFKESAEAKLNKIVGKYKGIGAEMEQICNQLTVYENQIKDSNKDIARMYEQAKTNYRALTAYILAGEQAIKEIEMYRDSKQEELEKTGNTDLQFEIQNINQALVLMEQRVADLRSAEAVALQSVPTFKIQEYTNANLARKVNSAFVVTVPAFKTALVNSVVAKQQALQMQGLAALDEATSTLIRANADSAVQQLQRSQQLANSSAVKADDIEYAWNTIMTGIQQYKEMEQQYREIRKDEAKRIEAANTQYLQSLAEGSAI